MKYKYEIIIYWSNNDESYIAEAPELPGCMADGKSYEDAVNNIQTVIEQWIETSRELGREIPIPKGKIMYA